MDTPRPLSPEHHGTRTHSELACCLSYLATVPLQRPDDSFWIKAHTQILAQIVRYVVGEHADLAKDGKFPEILILAKQVNLPTRRVSEALGAAITTLNQQHAELAEAGNPRWSLPHTGPGEMGGAGALAGAALGSIGGPVGVGLGGLTGMAAGIAASMIKMANLKKNIEKLEEAKQWLEGQ